MNVDMGIWKNRSVTLGKGLDLRVGPRGLCTNISTDRGGCGEICRPSGWSFGGLDDE